MVDGWLFIKKFFFFQKPAFGSIKNENDETGQKWRERRLRKLACN
jgi:hypothetical protein